MNLSEFGMRVVKWQVNTMKALMTAYGDDRRTERLMDRQITLPITLNIGNIWQKPKYVTIKTAISLISLFNYVIYLFIYRLLINLFT